MSVAHYYEKKGVKQGIEQGIKQGIEQGIEQGIKQGKQEAKEEIALNLLCSGVAPVVIAKSSGLTLDELELLSAKIKN